VVEVSCYDVTLTRVPVLGACTNLLLICSFSLGTSCTVVCQAVHAAQHDAQLLAMLPVLSIACMFCTLSDLHKLSGTLLALISGGITSYMHICNEMQGVNPGIADIALCICVLLLRIGRRLIRLPEGTQDPSCKHTQTCQATWHWTSSRLCLSPLALDSQRSAHIQPHWNTCIPMSMQLQILNLCCL